MSITKQSSKPQVSNQNQQHVNQQSLSKPNDADKSHTITSKLHHRKARTQATQYIQFHRLMQSKAKQFLFAQSQANTSFQSSQFQYAAERFSNKYKSINYHKDHQISAFKPEQPCYQSIKKHQQEQFHQEKGFRIKQKNKLQPTAQQQAYWNKRNHRHPVFRPAVLNPTFSIPLSRQQTKLIMMNQNKIHSINEEGVNLEKFNQAMKNFALRTQGLCMSNEDIQQQSYVERKKKKILQLSKKVMKSRCKSLNSIQQQYQKQHVISDIQKYQSKCLLNLRIKKLNSLKKEDNELEEESRVHFLRSRQKSNQYPVPKLGLQQEEQISNSIIRLKNKSKSCAIGQFNRCQNKKLAVMKILSKMAKAKVQQKSNKRKSQPMIKQATPSDFLRSIKLKIHDSSKELSQQKEKNITTHARKQIDKTVKQFCIKMKSENIVICSLMKNNLSIYPKQFLPNS